MAFLKDDKTPEGIKEIDGIFNQADHMPHIFFTPEFRITVKAMAGVFRRIREIANPENIDNVIYDPRLTEVPIEEKKRREAAKKGKPYRVPEWWRGEAANYKVAKSMMGVLPKKMGPVKDG